MTWLAIGATIGFLLIVLRSPRIDPDIPERAIATLLEMEMRDYLRGGLRQQHEREVAEMVRLHGPEAERIINMAHRMEAEHVAYAMTEAP